jgi:hypothetical protein
LFTLGLKTWLEWRQARMERLVAGGVANEH